MKVWLFDTNVLIAILDPDHLHHEIVQGWLTRSGIKKWATCPITQNGYVRIVSQSKYDNPITAVAAIALLTTATASRDHQFWSDGLSITDGSVFSPEAIRKSEQVTDTYLLALAKLHNGILATMDRRLSLDAVPNGHEHYELVA